MKNIVFLSIVILITSSSYAADELTKGLIYQPAIKVKDKATFKYIDNILSRYVGIYSNNLDSIVDNNGLQSFESTKESCYLEGAANTYLDFLNENKQFLNPKTSKLVFLYINRDIEKAKKINLGRCLDVSNTLNKQYEMEKKAVQQEIINQLMNVK